MFHILKSAVYIHGISRGYETSSEAQEAFWKEYNSAETSINGDFDGYHDYHIVNGLPQFTGKDLEIDKASSVKIIYEPKRVGR